MTSPDKKLAQEDKKIDEAASILEDASLVEVVADAGEEVAEEEARSARKSK